MRATGGVSVGVIWNKIWRDLASNRARTLLAVLSTAVGIFALGLVFGLSGVLRPRIMESHQAAAPAHITFWGGPFSPEIVKAMLHDPNVAAAEGEIIASFRWKLEGEAEWRDGDLIARADYRAQRTNLLRLRDGHWPDDRLHLPLARRRLAIERLSSQHFSGLVGSTILVEIGERQHRMPVEGIVSAPVVLPPEWGGNAMFYATPETAAWLSRSQYGEDFNRLHILLESYSDEAAKGTAQRIEDRLDYMELSAGGYEITDPDEHWVQDIVDATMMILMVIGALSLGLSTLLIVNTISAMLVQQLWQIGVMKAIGATSGRVMRVYLTMVLIYGALALLLAVPLAAVGTHLLASWLLDIFNVELSAFQVDPMAIGIQIVVGVAVPMLAAAVPVAAGARITVREAIGSYGLGSDFGASWVDRLMAKIRRLPRPLVLSLRNTFRRKARVVLTLVTLTFSGAMFTMVLSTGASLDNTIASSFSVGEDVAVELDRPRCTWRTIEIAKSVPGVAGAEVWNRQEATLLLPSDEEHPVDLTGIPSDSVIFRPNIVSGRSLLPGEGKALVFTLRLAEEEGIEVGDEITLSIGDRESEWTVVGHYLSVNDVSDEFFVPLDVLQRETGSFRRGRRLQVLVEIDAADTRSPQETRHPAEFQQQVIEGLKDGFAAEHIEVVDSWSASEQLAESQASFGILTSILLAMVILTAIVGGMGLMSTMSMNVVERRREIGVMRAVGASSPTLIGIFVAEGVLVGALSWLLALPLSYPGARLFSDLIGAALLNMPLDFVYSAGGMAFWLLVVAGLSALASLWPALQAMKVSVRQALAYD
jgi:putative ABC transport system permease protein